jgi:hypothetical protein
MTDLRTAAQQALEALTEYGCAYLRHQHAYDEAITALRAALEQPDGPCPTCVALARTVMMDQMGTA